MDTIIHGVTDLIKDLHTPRHTLRTRTRDTHLTKRVESEVPKFKTFLPVALQECIKFGVNLSKEIAVLDGQWVCLESIDANRKDSVLVYDHAAMFLPARDLKALRVCEVNQLAVLVGVQDHYINFLFKPNTLFRVM